MTTAENKHGSTVITSPSTVYHWRWWLFIVAIGVFAFGIRYYYVTHAVVFQPVYAPTVGDSSQYYYYAFNLVEHSVFSLSSPRASAPIADNFRDPGYPVFLAGLLRLSPSWESWYADLLICQTLLGALTVVLWVRIGARCMPMSWLAAAGVLMALWPHSVTMTSIIMSETLFGFLCALSMLLFCIVMNRNKLSWSAASGLSFSLTALTNAVMLPFAALLSIYMWMRHKISGRAALTLIVIMLCAITPWSIRNGRLPPDHLSSSYRACMNLVQGSWPSYHNADVTLARKNDPNATKILQQINLETRTIYADPAAGTAMIWHRLSRNPSEYIRWYLMKPTLLWGWSLKIGEGPLYFNYTYNSPYEVNPLWRTVSAICFGLNPFLLLLAATGCVLSIHHRRAKPAMAATALLLLFVTLIYSTLQAEPRYSIPFRGPEILLSTYAAYRICKWIAILRMRYPKTRRL